MTIYSNKSRFIGKFRTIDTFLKCILIIRLYYTLQLYISKKKKKNWLSNFMYGLLKINFWLRHYMLHCKYTQHRSLLVLVSSSSGKKKCLNQSLCHKITESMTTYSFISYKLSPQFRYHCISQCHLEEM